MTLSQSSNTKEQHEPKRYKVLNGTYYDHRTPDDLIRILESARMLGTRLILIYGNKETGAIWESATPQRGNIGRSAGNIKVPLLVRSKRSPGGEAILDHCILEVKASPGGRVLWKFHKGQ
jgi:hypothetical protein